MQKHNRAGSCLGGHIYTSKIQSAAFHGRHCQRERKSVLHEHCPQLQKVIVLWVLHLHDAPWIEAASDLLAFGFNQLIGSIYHFVNFFVSLEVCHNLKNHAFPL